MDGNGSIPDNLKFESLEERSICDRFLYYELYLWKLDNAPKDIHRFCDPKIDEKLREKLIKWIRYSIFNIYSDPEIMTFYIEIDIKKIRFKIRRGGGQCK